MELFIIAVAAFFTSALTFFSGFGLGTLLLPVFALFFPVDIAVSATAIVHLLNNVFKWFLIGRHADRSVVLRFGLPAILAAFGGAQMLLWFANLKPIFTYSLGEKTYAVLPIKLAIGVLIILFAFFEFSRKLQRLSLDQKWLPLGGVLSGFFGGLSGHQGAFRSAFLLRCGLTKESYIATGVIIASLVDFARLSIYSSRFTRAFFSEYSYYLLVAILAAFTGAFWGNRTLKKLTMRTVQIFVSVMLFLIGLGLIAGII